VSVDGETARLEVEARNQRGEDVLKGARAEVWLGEPIRPPATATGSPRAYGPYVYEAGLETIRDFALTVAGGIPTRVVSRPPDPPPHPWHVDEAAARASPWGAVIAPPTFAAVFAIRPFADALGDPSRGIDVLRLQHGEQELRLHGPIRAGDRLTTTGEVVVDEVRGRLRVVVVRSLTANARGELVVEGRWTAVVR
jgi:hypothetical protein